MSFCIRSNCCVASAHDHNDPWIHPREPNRNTIAQDIKEVLNRHSAENASNTPDWLLAQYLLGALDAFNKAVNQREVWCGRLAGVRPSQRSVCVDHLLFVCRTCTQDGRPWTFPFGSPTNERGVI